MAAPCTPSPQSQDGDKNTKYDRQLRLWGDHGQSSLESARVCLVNAGATGTETLKNLILPGVGSFTIVDGKRVQGEDVGNNFFLEQDSIGKSRAEAAKLLLEELNEDVHGDYVEESVEELMENNPDFFASFTCVIVTELNEKSLLKLGGYLWERNVPLVICCSYGFLGYIRIVIPEHNVIESHPDSVIEDLRLDNPFSSLVEFCDRFDLDSMNRKEHSHTPWLIILYKYLQKYRELYGALPKSYKEKNILKELIRQGRHRNDEGLEEEEENFDEAMRAVNTALVTSRIPEDVKRIFQDKQCQNITVKSPPFWIAARALREFTENEGRGFLPLRGTIPDMTSDSERYVELQSIYRQQAMEDVSVVSDKVQRLLGEVSKRCLVGMADRYKEPRDALSDSYIKLMCKNAAFLKCLRYRSLAEEYDPGTSRVSDLGLLQIEDSECSEGIHYILIRAVARFRSEYSRYPGFFNHQVESDISKLKLCVSKLLQEWGLGPNLKDDYVHEMCRYGASELHTVAAVIGGTAAQEVIKIITGQFTPLNNTFIYNAMKQTSTSLEL